MATTTIHSLAYKVSMDSQKFTQGSIATKKELREGKRLFNETRTDAEKYASQLDRISELYQRGAIDADTYSRAVAKVKEQQERASKTTSAFGSAFSNLKSQMTALLPVVTAAGIVAGVKRTADAIDETAKSARKFGIDFNELRQIQYAASIDTSVSVEQLGKSLQKMGIFVSDVGKETTKTTEALESLQLTSDALVGKSIQQQFLTIADAIANVSDENERLALAQDIFGKSGADLIPMLEKGSDAIRGLAEEHQRLVGNLTEEQTSKIENANDSLTRVGASMQKIAESAALLAAGPLETVSTGLSTLAQAFNKDGSFVGAAVVNSGANIDMARATAYADKYSGRTAINNYEAATGDFVFSNIARLFTMMGREALIQEDVTRQRQEQMVRLHPDTIRDMKADDVEAQRRTRVN
jgi:hypothetical protein